VLEAIVDGKLYWVPFHRIQSIEITEPVDLRDKVWMPAQFQWANGGQVVGFLPARYPGSESHEDDGIRLAGKTEWVQVTDSCYHGLGQKTLATDAGDFALLDVRKIELEEQP
jgi:type VI secretion system protein ImpE